MFVQTRLSFSQQSHNSLLAGRRAIVPGALSIGAVCTLLQLAYNEAGIIRLQYISGLNRSRTLPTPTTLSAPSLSMSDRFLALLGLKPVTDEEYIAKVKTTRDGYLKRIAELEQQVAVEAQAENKSS